MGFFIVAAPHERWDGAGYPGGLVGGKIPLFSRILSVADVYDEITNGRHGPKLAKQAAVAELRRVSGSQLDPIIADVFATALEQDPPQA